MPRAARKTGPPIKVMDRIMRRLASSYDIDRFVRNNGPDPFRILIGCVISLRTKDEVSYAATDRLFERASSPETMSKVRQATIARLIYPAGFYNRKAEQIREISKILVAEYGGRVPDSLESLLKLPGVGRKTANLVVTLGFGKPGICVDIHVHRISNRLGWVETSHPDETEQVLRAILPRRHWIPINETLVRPGQQVCKPTSPICSACPLETDCPKTGVTRQR